MKIVFRIAALMISAISTNLHSAPHCGELTIAYGETGGDYTNSDHRKYKLPIVEKFHFTPNVENLIKGNSGHLGGELTYTLERFPNHHRALVSFAKLGLRDKTPKPIGSRFSVECAFDRALRYKPGDGTVRMIYGNYLTKLGKNGEALEQLKEAISLQPEDPTINYNLGLLYMQKKDYEQAKTYAKKAYELGFPLPGLKNQLMQAGKWED